MFRTLTLIALVGCGGGGGEGDDDVPAPDAPPTSECRTPAADDRTRYVVLARPYDTEGNSAPVFEVLELSAAGSLTRFDPPRKFELGARTPFGVIAFTPDGKVGFVAMDNGDLGVFSLDDAGNPTVVEASFNGAFYASRVIMDPSGEHAWVVDENTRENGGGIYRVDIGCDNTVTDGGLVAAARSPGGLAFAGDRAVLAARDLLDSPAGDNLHLIDLADGVRIGGGDAFGMGEQSFSGFAVSADGGIALVGDSNFAGPNRVAVAKLTATAATRISVVPDITDPSAIAISPFGDVAVVSSSQPPGEGIYVLDANGPGGAWQSRGELAYVGPAAQLPGDMTTIARGQLAGSVLVSELSNVRRLVFHDDGTVTDAGSLAFGEGLEEIGGAIGVTP